MTNPARKKGTVWETELLRVLRTLFGPDVHRAPLRGIHDNGDFVGVPWPHEAKNTKVPQFLAWARVLRKKTTVAAWALLWKGDRRTEDGSPIVMLPIDLYVELVGAWNAYVHREPPCDGNA